MSKTFGILTIIVGWICIANGAYLTYEELTSVRPDVVQLFVFIGSIILGVFMLRTGKRRFNKVT